MPGSITPLPIMLEEEDRKIYDHLEPPKSIVVQYGYQKLIAELAYDGEAKPGCGSKMVIRSSRGIEMGQMLTTTCANAGCGKSISRKQMLEYIENSGGKDYPFSNQGKVLRVASAEDVHEQARMDAKKPDMIRMAKRLIIQLDLPMKLVDIELLLGGERIIFYYTAEQWVDFRELVRSLAGEYQARIEMHQVNAREEARLVADYERCGQQCCCKQFLKVLKPVSMRSAKVQKATLDPTKISGRCGRLMCCLRYEDQTYESLRKKLPHKQSRVQTEEGLGTVIDTQILTQLALVRLDNLPKVSAFPIENIEVLTKEAEAQLLAKADEAKAKEAKAREAERRGPPPPPPPPVKRGGKPPGAPAPRRGAEASAQSPGSSEPTGGPGSPGSPGADEKRVGNDADSVEGQPKRRRRRRRGGGGQGGSGS